MAVFDESNYNGNGKNPSMYFLESEISTDSEDILDPLSEELRNIKSVIHVTRENIDALNARFADFQQPPAMYLEEYQELTSKLHELEIKEQDLVEKIQQNEVNIANEPPDLPDPEPDPDVRNYIY